MESKKELKMLAKQANLKNYQNDSKEKLAKKLGITLSPSREVLKNMARERGWKGYQNLKKEDLKKLLNIPIPAPRTKKDFSEKPIPAPRTKKDFSEKPIPAPRIKKDFSEKPIPAPRIILENKNPIPILKLENVEVNAQEAPSIIQNSVEIVSGWLKWLAESGKKYIINPVLEKLKNLKDNVNKLFEEKFKITQGDSALRDFIRKWVIEGKPGYDPRSFFKAVKKDVLKILKENTSTKVKFMLECLMEKKDLKTQNIVTSTPAFISKIEINLPGDEEEIFHRMVERILELISNYQNMGSNWVFIQINNLEIHFANWKPIKGSSYVELPKKFKNKKAVINIKNDDNECFKWSVARALLEEKNPQRISNALREKAKTLKWDDIKFPVSLKDIKTFEKNNPELQIYVFGYEDSIYQLRRTQNTSGQIIDLLLCENHYFLINNLSRLLSGETKHNGHKIFCRNCLNHFPKTKIKEHQDYCLNNAGVKLVLPEKGKLKFQNYHKSQRVPVVVYADFEAFNKKVKNKRGNTQQYQQHQPSGFCYKIVGLKEKTFSFRAQADENIGEIFVKSLEKDLEEIFKEIDMHKPMIPLTEKEKEKYQRATKCWICKQEIFGVKVRDHDHFTGKFRGAAHKICNLRFKKADFVPVFFHNLAGYDSHLFVKNLGITEGEIRCIPNNDEKYISFSKVKEKFEIRFLDSLKFMASPLASLTANLKKSGLEKFVYLKKEFGEQFELLTQKGIYPYDYMDGIERFKEQLPPQKDFYSKLNGAGVSDEDYQYAQMIWANFKISDLGEYHDLYLKTDVMLLADIFEEFRMICYDNYQLDPAWYYTAPGLSWDALLKHSKIELELLSDPDHLLMFEKGIRGGVSMIPNRWGKANNKYMDNFDNTKPSKFITYLDANNLYGWAMMQPLPVGKFRWMTEEDLNNWREIPCVLEVDLEYPKELFKEHNDYPLAPERLKIGRVEKLVPNLWDKNKYVLHKKNLQLYLDLGLRLTKIHRGIKFQEFPWMQSYIELNTDLRTKGKNDFEKDFFKLMNNSVFGKTMENIRNRVNVQLVTTAEKAQKLIAKPNLKHWVRFDENLIGVHLNKTKMTYNKPVYCGMSILDISKTLMYEFHYKYMNKFKKKLLFTDTDSLCYEIQTDDFFADIKDDVETMFDTSNFGDHPSGIQGKNKKIPGMMKDEAGGKIIEEFVGLRAKLYSYKMYDGKTEKKCKGMKKSVIKNNISFEDYKECLLTKVAQMRQMNVIRSIKHNIFSETVNKIALSADDDKRIILDDGITTNALGWEGYCLGGVEILGKKIALGLCWDEGVGKS